MKEPPFPNPNGPFIFLQAISKLCTLFWGPNLPFCQSILNPRYFDPFAQLESDIAYVPADAVFLLQQEIRVHSNPRILLDHLEESYVRLFVNTKGKLSAYLYASCYEKENSLMMNLPAVEMKQRLAEVGLAVAKDRGEPPDHLCIELEYLYFLLQKGWVEHQKDFIDEAMVFIRQSLIPWISIFNKRLKAETTCRFYPVAASLLLSCLRFIGDPP